MNNLIVLLCVWIMASIFDMFTRFKNCLCSGKIEILPVLLFHRLLWIFMFFGWLFNDKFVLILYLGFLIIIQLHWFFNNNKCIITEIEINICDLPEDSYSDYFYNFFKQNLSLYYGIFQLILGSIAIYKLCTL